MTQIYMPYWFAINRLETWQVFLLRITAREEERRKMDAFGRGVQGFEREAGELPWSE